jgi:hypothetical protein
MAQWNKDTQAYRSQDTTNFEVYMCADQFGNIGACGGSMYNEINIAAGLTPGYANVHKFGAVETTAATYDTVWSKGGAYVFPSSASVVTVASSSGTDSDTANTGAETITIQGLDGSYNEVEETLSLNGSTDVTGNQQFLRVHRAFIASGVTNVGNIDIKHGSTVICYISAGMGQTQVAYYTVPAGKTAYLKSFAATQNKNQENSVRMFQRPSGGVFRVASELNLYGSNMHTLFTIPIRFTEKTDIDVRSYTGSNCTVSSMFDLLLVDNP